MFYIGTGRGVFGLVRPKPLFFNEWLNLGRLPGDPETSPGDDPMNNSSFFTADRATHVKIVVVSLLASIAVMVVGIAARPHATDGALQTTVYKPQKAIMATSDVGPEVR